MKIGLLTALFALAVGIAKAEEPEAEVQVEKHRYEVSRSNGFNTATYRLTDLVLPSRSRTYPSSVPSSSTRSTVKKISFFGSSSQTARMHWKSCVSRR
jgi:hypothetical protein